jgi:hypothetical protein
MREFESVRLAREIAGELGDGWVANDPPDDDSMVARDMHYLHDADGNEIGLELIENGTRVELRAVMDWHTLRDHYPYDAKDKWPKNATVAVARGAAPMAKRCATMIPALREINADARKRKAESEAQSYADYNLTVELARLLGNPREVRLRDTHGRRELLTRFEASYYPHKVEVSHGSITMELRSVTADQARAIARILNDSDE